MKCFEAILHEANLPKKKNGKIDVVQFISSQLRLESTAVVAGIKKNQFRINFKPIRQTEIVYKKGSKITFGNQEVNFDLIENDHTPFDLFVRGLISQINPDHSSIISAQSRTIFSSYLIAYFSFTQYEPLVVLDSKYNDLVILELETFYKQVSKDSKTPKLKELIEYLVGIRTEKYRELQVVTENLTNGIYNNNLHKFLQDYSKIFSSVGFQSCLLPLISSSVCSKIAIEGLIKPIHDARQIKEVSDRFYHFEEVKNVYANYSSLLNNKNLIHQEIYLPLFTHFQTLIKDECDTKDVKLPKIDIVASPRKYNFTNSTRDEHELLLIIKNVGEGLARNVNISSANQNFICEKALIGILKPKEVRELKISAKLGHPVSFKPILKAFYQCQDISGNNHQGEFDIIFQLQKEGIPWEGLEKSKPYTIQEIEERDKLYGRDQILDELKANILSEKIESYKIWGQKRVGKSSIVKTLRSLFNEDEKIIVVWRSIAGLKNVDPLKTLDSLGESLSSEIFEEIDRKIKDHFSRERLRSIEVPEFDGSFFPLEKYIKKLKNCDRELKFIFILDEFDRINEEFFLPGKLGDTLSLNIGKGLNENNFIGFILVGSENMHLLDRQGVNYNSYQEREVDTFSKEFEFDSFKKIITEPVHPHIVYSVDAIERIYNVTAGNPYFANLICSHIFKIAAKNRDGEIDKYITEKAIDTIVNSSQKSHFEHFWSDGITEESNIKKERKADIRRRILISYSFVHYQDKDFPLRANVLKSFNKPAEYTIEQYEIENTVKEFFNRKIFFEDSQQKVRIRPLLFEKWLCGPGRTLLIEGISDLEALQRQKELEEEYSLKEEELKRISENFPFQGSKISVKNIRDFFEQFGGPIEQRRVYKIFDSIYYISKDEINDFFKREQKTLFAKTSFNLKVGVKTLYRDAVEIYSFPNTLSENIDLVESFKVFSHIRSTKTLKDIETNKDAWKNSAAEDIVIFENVLSDFAEVNKLLLAFLDERIVKDKIPVKFCVLLISSKAKADLIKATASFSNFKLIHFREVEDSKIKPFIETTDIFETAEEAGYAFAEIRKQLGQIQKDCLNVVTESVCPSKSIPILWCKTDTFKPLFPNVHGRLQLVEDATIGEELRMRLYKANTELSQKLNKYIVDYLKSQANEKKIPDWFRVELIPKAVVTSVSAKYIADDQKNGIETYFDFLDYFKIIEKTPELMVVFKRASEGIKWLEKLNNLRRDPAHPEKPAPLEQDVIYFETIKDEIISRMK